VRVEEDQQGPEICVLPVGGKASTGDQPFTPPWAE
jgi:hypothetical protein